MSVSEVIEGKLLSWTTVFLGFRVGLFEISQMNET